jgi:GNAT superfamily N-acetyltransferase
MHAIRIRFELNILSYNPDPSRFVSLYTGEVFWDEDSEDDSDEDGENEIRVGEIEVFVVNRRKIIDEAASFFEAMDATSPEALECYEAIFDEEIDDWKQDVVALIGEDAAVTMFDVLLIKRLELEEKYRGKGIGTEVAHQVIRVLGSNCAVIACKPFPLQYSGYGDPERETERAMPGFEEKREEAVRKVCQFWTGAGFKSLYESDYYVWSTKETTQ